MPILSFQKHCHGVTTHNVDVTFVVSAVGCSDLVPPSDAWLKRSDNVATVGCYIVTTCWQLDFHVLTDKQTG